MTGEAMIGVMSVGTLGPAELALRLDALRGTAVYAAYLATPDKIDIAIAELQEELEGFDASATISVSSPRDAGALIAMLAADPAEILLVQASAFSTADWALLDRRRSSIAHRGLLVFLTTQTSFDELMRQAPNLASWLGGQVFAYPADDDGPQLAAHREQRLAALRAWASQTDAEILEAARRGTLPPDPEYAEWLVLLGHSELLNSPAS
jgi:hypothetical protein